MKMPNHHIIYRGRKPWGKLDQDYTFNTPIKGYARIMGLTEFRCMLSPDGNLTIYKDSVWDYGSGLLTVQDLGMIRASLAHDAFCHMTDRGILPWKERSRADDYFASLLWNTGRKGIIAAASTSWRWIAVRSYSTFIAYWRREK